MAGYPTRIALRKLGTGKRRHRFAGFGAPLRAHRYWSRDAAGGRGPTIA